MTFGQGRMTRDALVFLPAKILEGVIAMLTISLYTRLFSTAAYGAFIYINTTVTFLYLVLVGWLANSTVRYIGDEMKKEDGREFFSTVMLTYLTTILAAFLLAVTAYFVTRDPLYIAGAAMLAAYALFQMLNGMLVQAGLIRWSVLLSLLSVCVKLGAAYLFVYLMAGGSGKPYPAVFASITADFAAGILAVIALKIPGKIRLKNFSKSLFGAFLKYGAPLMGVSISVALLNMIDRYLVSFFFGADQLAIYGANYSISSGLFTLIMAGVMRGVYPAVLGGWRKDGIVSAQPLLNAGARLYMLVALPAAAGLLGVCQMIARCLLKQEYYAGAYIIGIIALGMFFMGLTEYANKAWELTKNTSFILQNSAVSAIIEVAVCLMLLPSFGIVGAAFGTLASYACYFFITFFRVRKLFVFHLSARQLLNICGSSFVCGAAAYFTSHLPGNRFVILITSVIAGALAYLICLSLSGEIKGEIVALRNHFKRNKSL